MEQEAKELSTSELSGIGLLDFAKDIQNRNYPFNQILMIYNYFTYRDTSKRSRF